MTEVYLGDKDYATGGYKMDIYSGRLYHLKINTNIDFEALILVSQIYGALTDQDEETLTFRVLASTIDTGHWIEMFVKSFYKASPVEVSLKDLPLYLNWKFRTNEFYEMLKGSNS
jgi:hypothetical protein